MQPSLNERDGPSCRLIRASRIKREGYEMIAEDSSNKAEGSEAYEPGRRKLEAEVNLGNS